MYLQHVFGLFSHPHSEWNSIKSEKESGSNAYLLNIILMAAIAPISLYVGSTQIGWSVIGGEFTKIEVSRAVPLSVAFYFALLMGVGFMSYITFWMEKTFGADASFQRCVTLVSFTATLCF